MKHLSTPEQIAQAERVVAAAAALSQALGEYGSQFSALDDHLRSAMLDAVHGAFRVAAVLNTDLNIVRKATV